MPTNLVTQRASHFEQHGLLWLSLHHFLPAPLLQEFAAALIGSMSDGMLSLSNLFETVLSAGPGPGEAWAVAPKPVEQHLARYLQQVIRALVWENDTTPIAVTEQLSVAEQAKVKALEGAIAFAHFDLQTDVKTLETTARPCEPGIGALLATMKALRDPDLSNAALEIIIDEAARSTEMPLTAVLVKHLGDLCADSDRWNCAAHFYKRASQMFEAADDQAWEELTGPMKVILLQSQATAARMIDGPAAAADLLARSKGTNLADAPLLRINFANDALDAEARSGEPFRFVEDRRASVLFSPLALPARDLSGAFNYWAHSKYHDAHREFWAVLRRQIALGSVIASRVTKVHYAKCIAEFLRDNLNKLSEPDLFFVAVRLLLDGGANDLGRRVDWTEGIIRAYVNVGVIERLAEKINHAPGARTERTLVLITIFEAWLKGLQPDAVAEASAMLRHLAALARGNEWLVYSDRNIGGNALDALRETAKRRPEFRALAGGLILPAVRSKLKGDLRGVAAALEMLLPYFDAMPEPDRIQTIILVLDLLDPMDASEAFWPVVVPVLTLLTDPVCKALPDSHSDLGRRIVQTVIRFGMGQESQKTRLLSYLRNVPKTALEEYLNDASLKAVVDDVRKRATQNSSNAPNCMSALLASAAAAGPAGVTDALNGLNNLVGSAKAQRPALSLASGYEPLLVLIKEHDEIAAQLATDTLTCLLDVLFRNVVALWGTAHNRPVILAPFSLPEPTAPHRVVVHNWAFASIGLARMMDRTAEMDEALNAAAANPQLKDPIALARASRLTAGDPESFDLAAITLENRDTFYGALGQRLLLLRKLPEDKRRPIVCTLMEQCLHLGPRGMDGALFGVAIDLSIAVSRGQTHALNYAKRLENERDLRLSLMPLFNAVTRTN